MTDKKKYTLSTKFARELREALADEEMVVSDITTFIEDNTGYTEEEALEIMKAVGKPDTDSDVVIEIELDLDMVIEMGNGPEVDPKAVKSDEDIIAAAKKCLEENQEKKEEFCQWQCQLPKDVFDAIDSLAKREHRTFSGQALYMLEKFTENYTRFMGIIH